MPSRSNWVPLEVTVKFSVMADQVPGAPQLVGGLCCCMSSTLGATGAMNDLHQLDNFRPRRSIMSISTAVLIHSDSQAKREGKVSS